MKFRWLGSIALGSLLTLSAHAQTPQLPAGAATTPAKPTADLSMECHLLYRGVPMPEPTFYHVVGDELYGISGPIKTKLSKAGAPISLGSSKDTDGSTTESFASHTLSGTTLERTVFWKKGSSAMKRAFTETYDFRASTVVNSTDKTDFCHAKGR